MAVTLVAAGVSGGVGDVGPGARVAGAQSPPADISYLVGNFTGSSSEMVFAYSPSGPEILAWFHKDGVEPGGEIKFALWDHSWPGSFVPIAGDFDGDGEDEIVYYAPGRGDDLLVNFVDVTGALISDFPSVNGTYQPISGDFTGDGTDDILWYAPGTAPDSLWDFAAGGSHVSRPVTINGRYRPVAGSFGRDAVDDVFWHGPGAVGDSLWDFGPGGAHVSRPHTVNGSYEPFEVDLFADGAGGGDIFWYAPGAPADHVWDFTSGGYRSFPEPVPGDWTPVAGDLLADGAGDVLWWRDVGYEIWDSVPDDDGFRRDIYYGPTGP